MDYLTFKAEVEKRLKDFLPEEMKDYEIVFKKITKVNEELDAFLIKPNDGNMAPTGYISIMYEVFKETGDFEAVCRDYLESMAKAYSKDTDRIKGCMPDFTDVLMREKIVFQLINTKANEGMLKEVPNRAYHDLSIIYRLILDNDPESLMSTIINNEIAEHMQLTEEQLFKLAVVNTRERGIEVNDVFETMMKIRGMNADDMEEFNDEFQCMYILTNSSWMYGASAVLYEDELHKISKKLGTDLYLLPSSTHEFLVIPAGHVDPYKLADIVHSINNKGILEQRSKLSNNVYHYSKDLRRVSMATDTPIDIRD